MSENTVLENQASNLIKQASASANPNIANALMDAAQSLLDAAKQNGKIHDMSSPPNSASIEIERAAPEGYRRVHLALKQEALLVKGRSRLEEWRLVHFIEP